MDAQGGVIPGATVFLISETRGTRSAPVVTNASGDYVIPNLADGSECRRYDELEEKSRHNGNKPTLLDQLLDGWTPKGFP